MSYNFKNLADVEALESVPENATVLVEADGAIKRVPGNGLGGGKMLIIKPEGEGYTANMTFDEFKELMDNYDFAGGYINSADGSEAITKASYYQNAYHLSTASYWTVEWSASGMTVTIALG